MTVTCDYCGEFACLVNGDEIYPHRPDLHHRSFYRCEPCKAHVGCHPGTTRPLGRLANAELRMARAKAHAAFDPLWKRLKDKPGKKNRRTRGYLWLSHKLGIHYRECHIGMFDEETCRKVVEICRR